MELQKKYARGRTIDNCIQTNGTMLTDEWCEFFRENNWLVGVSIDGPQEFHDEYRKNKMGKPSFCESDARHQSFEKTWGRMECDGSH